MSISLSLCMIDTFKLNVIDALSNNINRIIQNKDLKFINEGVIVFELSKCLTLLEKDKDRISQNYPNFIDLSIVSQKLYIEVKYIRGIPSNKHIPVTNKFGQIINDMAKLAEKINEGFRIVIVVSDRRQIDYFKNNDPRFVAGEGSIIIFDDLSRFDVLSIKDKIKYDLKKLRKVKLLRNVDLGELIILAYLINP